MKTEEEIKEAVLRVIAGAVDARTLAEAVSGAGDGDGRGVSATDTATATATVTTGTQRLLERIVLGDILDDAILEARPSDRSFPLRVFFGELGALLAKEGDVAEHAFALASGLNFFFRAEMESEAQVRVAIEVSRAFYVVAKELDAEMVAKAAPLLAALMSSSLERVKLESVDHVRTFDSSLHERAPGADPTGSRIVRPATFLCRVTANNAVKAKAQVVT